MEASGLKIRRIIFSSLVLTTILVAPVGAKTAHADAIIRAPNNLGLVGYWSFDEGRGTQASDLSGNGNDGTLNGNPEWVVGRSKGALEFDGSNAVDVSNSASLSVATGLTVSAWINADYIGGYDGGYATIVSKRTGATQTPYHLYITNSGKLRLNWYSPTDGWRSYDSTVSITTNEWFHVVVTRGGGSILMYIDGEEVFSGADTVDVTTQSQPLRIGGPTTQYFGFPGKMDEVRIYNRALSEAEVQSLYASTSSTLVGRTPTEQHSDGLVAHYTFDGKHTTATTVTDIVGGNDGTINGATVAPGVVGQALNFDGTNDLIQGITIPSMTEYTASAWVKRSESTPSDSESIIAGRTSSTGYFSLLAIRQPGDTFYSYRSSSDTSLNSEFIVPKNEFVHLVSVQSGGEHILYANGVEVARRSGHISYSALELQIGRGYSGRFYGGVIDDVRIYNKALSANEVADLYAATKPSSMASSSDSLVTEGLVGHWSMDESSIVGTTISNLAGGEYNGTIYGGPISTTGVLEEALDFDSNDDYIQVDHQSVLNPDMFSVSLWARVDGDAGSYRSAITSRRGTPQGGYIIYAGNNNIWQFWTGNGSGWSTLSGGGVEIGEWVHLVITHDGVNGTLYQDGVKTAGPTAMVYTKNNQYPIRIGAGVTEGSPNFYFNGLIDDVRIYNRVLTESEVEQLYSMGQ